MPQGYPQRSLPFKDISSPLRDLGKYLKKLRAELGLSLRDVASRCKLTPGYISKIENGLIIKTIGIETLVNLSKAYDIPPEVILQESGFFEKIHDDLPSFKLYLKIKYGFNAQAIRDLEIAKEIVEKKYNIPPR